MVNGVKV